MTEKQERVLFDKQLGLLYVMINNHKHVWDFYTAPTAGLKQLMKDELIKTMYYYIKNLEE